MINLAGLSLEDKKQLQAQLAFELGGRGKIAAGDLPTPALEFWDSLQDAVGFRGASRQSPSSFIKTAGKAKLLAAADLVQAFVQEGSGRGLPKASRMAVMTAVLRCLVTHLNARGIPVSAAVVCNSLGVLPDAVDRRFPGYHEAKLIDRIAVRVA